MIAYAELQDSIDRLRRAETLAALHDDLCELTDKLGFDHYALAHHSSEARRPDTVALGSYPAIWVEEMVERRYYADDPVLIAAQSTARSFAWSEMAGMIRLTPKHRRQLELGAKAGLEEGVTVPINLPGSLPASCTFVVRDRDRFPDEALPHAHYAACHAFDAARRLAEPPPAETPPAPPLSTRQLDCIVLVSRGKSDGTAAQLLGISPDTVHQHVETAKRRLGVATRPQMVARALFDGHLSYADILN